MVEGLDQKQRITEELRIKYLRLHGIKSLHNPINWTFTLDRSIYLFICVYKFFQKYEKLLAKPENKYDKDLYSQIADTYDDFIPNIFPADPQIKFHAFARGLVNHNLEVQLRPIMYVFYTLKLYSFGWLLQQFCIKSRAKFVLTDVSAVEEMIADKFLYVFGQNYIEDTLFNAFNMRIFETQIQTFEALYSDFYGQFFGNPVHEQNDYTLLAGHPNSRPFSTFVSSGLRQYKKLYVWLTNGGHDRQKFRVFINRFRSDLTQTFEQMVDVFNDRVVEVLKWMFQIRRYQYCEEVVDVFALYSVRAVCFNVIRLVTHLHMLITFLLSDFERWESRVSYSLGKPGYTEMLDTIYYVYDDLNQLRTMMIVYNFDDELDRLTETIEQCRQSVKTFYKIMYQRITFQWIREIYQVYEFIDYQLRHGHPLPPMFLELSNRLISLQTCVGLSFSAHFIDLDRETGSLFRKEMNEDLEEISNNAVVSHSLAPFLAIAQPCRDHLANAVAVRTARPFQANSVFLHYITHQYPDIAALTPQQVGLDMTQADITII